MPLAPAKVQQRLDAERVAGERELSGCRVRDREREHAAKPRQRLRSPVPPRLEHDLGIGAGDEGRPLLLQLGPQFPVVVQLAVVDQREAALDQRLVGRRGQVDDRQPPVAEVDGRALVLVAPDRARVRTPVRDPLGHDVGQLVAVGLLVAPGDTAHARQLPAFVVRPAALLRHTRRGRPVPGAARRVPPRHAHGRACPCAPAPPRRR